MAAEAEQQWCDISSCWVWLKPSREGKTESGMEREGGGLIKWEQNKTEGSEMQQKGGLEVCVSADNKGWNGSVKEEDTKNH